MAREFTVVAIIAAYNEEDVVGQVVGHLIDQGVGVYLLDHGSTDDTVAEVKPFLGRGLLDIETFPDRSGGPPSDGGQFSWERILRRKEMLSRELDASWFIHHDADEFRESPWAHLGLRDAIHTVDTLGYTAVDFELFNFWPTHDRFRRGDDVRDAFRFYAPGRPWDKHQVKCWKKLAPVDLASNGGHDVAFEGRRVFPLRFILRHYPIRGQAHGERKVFRERRPRFVPAERARGWHVQYDEIGEHHSFIRDPGTLIPWDADAARLRLCLEHREVEELRESLRAREEAASASEASADGLRRDVEQLQRGLDDQQRHIAELLGHVETSRRALEDRQREIAGLHRELDVRERTLQERETHIGDLRREIDVRERTLRAFEGQVADLRRDVASRSLEERQRTLTETEAGIAEMRGALDASDEQLARAQREIDALSREVGAAYHRLDALYGSRSWRWMAPLRAAQRLLRGE